MSTSSKNIKNNFTFNAFNLAVSDYLLERVKNQSVSREISADFSLHLTHYFIPIGSYWVSSQLGFFFAPNSTEKPKAVK